MRFDPLGTKIECTKCREVFSKDKKHGRVCKKCRNLQQRNRRHKNRNYATIKYEKTKKGFLVRLYRNMKSRIEGVLKQKFHLYVGKELLKKEEFYEWAWSNPDFHCLFEEWEASGYERRLTPSVDRIDSRLGYFPVNMEFVPFHENCRNIRR